MKNIEKTEDKIRQICEELRLQAIIPANAEAERIVAEAKALAIQIKAEAIAERDRLMEQAEAKHKALETKLTGALKMAYEQALEGLKHEITTKVIRPTWKQLVKDALNKPDLIAQLLTSLVRGAEKEGISSVHAYVPASIDTHAVNALLANEIKAKLQEGGVLLTGEIQSGVLIRLVGEEIAFDFSGKALEELLFSHVYEGFRESFMDFSK